MKYPEITKWPDQPLEYDKDIPGTGTGHGWIQWKGTDVCMDVYCTCGAHGHLDTDFAYFYKCLHCGDTFAVGQTVRLYPIAKDKVQEIAGDRAKTTEDLPPPVSAKSAGGFRF